MKKLVFILILACFTINSYAATSITTPTVSGHWTLGGSPYLVYNDIEVADATSLVIDPGVSVIFQGNYYLEVNGIMRAIGTLSLPVIFTINDTTGFSTDLTTGAGGWRGIRYMEYLGMLPDSSTLQYCNISYTKALPGTTLDVGRALVIKNCSIHDNKMLSSGWSSGTIVSLAGYTSTDVIEFSGCEVYNNTGALVIAGSCDIFFHHNKVRQNTADFDIIRFVYCQFVFSNNEVYQNSVVGISSYGTLYTELATGDIKNSKFYENTNVMAGAIKAYKSFLTISGNLICNNQNATGTCGYTDGGGGIFLSGEAYASGSSIYALAGSSDYKIRNNVIANNLSVGWGGAICIQFSPAIIANNQIINNKAEIGGAILLLTDTNVIIKNNILYGNITGITSTAKDSSCIRLVDCSIHYEHNWATHPRYLEIFNFASIISGDTSTNIIGASPLLIAPTATANVTESALTANFDLLPASPCIDMGDTTGVSADPTDRAGNARIMGGTIDLGAYESISWVVTHIPNPGMATTIQVYPNPASNTFFVATTHAAGNIILRDVTGKTILEKNVVGNLTSLDIHTIPRGIYFAVWHDGNGTKATQKIVVE